MANREKVSRAKAGKKGKWRKQAAHKMKRQVRRQAQVTERHKLRRVLVSNGVRAADQYARDHGLTAEFSRLLNVRVRPAVRTGGS